jgi:lysozyme
LKRLTKKQKLLIAAAIAAFILLPMTKSFAEEFIIEQEGSHLTAYQDGGGVWTIGYGNTFNYDLNRPVRRGDTITEYQAIKYLRIAANQATNDVLDLVDVPLNQNQLESLTSFVFNIGRKQFAGSTLLRKLNEGRPKTEVAAEFDKWVFDNGVRVQGLVNRRKREKALFLK